MHRNTRQSNAEELFGTIAAPLSTARFFAYEQRIRRAENGGYNKRGGLLRPIRRSLSLCLRVGCSVGVTSPGREI
jgi:hypothetical protein